MTRRLYYDDSSRLEFSSRVVEVRELGAGRCGIVLEETCFYPTSGGQMHDRGELAELEIEDVVDESTQIVHVVRGTPPGVGAVVQGRIDGERRFHHRQQHSGQHVLSRILEDHHGWPTLSSRLGESMNTLEIPAPDVGQALMDDVEDHTNRVIWEGRPVRVRYLDEEAAAEAGLRKKVERAGPLRVIEMEGLDRCACGGTHVDNTAQIGLVALVGAEKMRGGTRLLFLCGERAVHWRRTRVAWLDRTARQLTTGQDLVPSTVSRLQDEVRERKKRMEAMAIELVSARAASWREDSEKCGGLRAILRVLDGDEALAATAAIHAAVQSGPYFAAFVIEQPGKRQVLAAAGEASGLDAGDVLRRVLGHFGGKGGGQRGFARGGCGEVDSVALLEAFRNTLRSESEDRR